MLLKNSKYSWLKNLSFLVVLLFLAFPNHGFSNNTFATMDTLPSQSFEKIHKNLLKIDIVSLFNNGLQLGLQRYITDRASIEITGIGIGLWNDAEFASRSGAGGELAFRFDFNQYNWASNQGELMSRILFWQITGGGMSVSEAKFELDPLQGELFRQLFNREYFYAGGEIGIGFTRGHFYVESTIGVFVPFGEFEGIEVVDEVEYAIDGTDFSDGNLRIKNKRGMRLSAKFGMSF